MNYYYDIILNWSEKNHYNFYEWNDTDYLELIKKIPFIRVKHKIFLDIAENNIKVSNDLLDKIKDKTLVSNKNSLNKIEYALLLTDGKNVLALEFNQEGLSISRSGLLIEDEINALEVAYALKETEMVYEIIESISSNKELRQINEIKRVINLEINNLYQNKEISKLKYLYFEYRKETCDDTKEIYETLMHDLKEGFKEEFLKLYEIIKLSYHKV